MAGLYKKEVVIRSGSSISKDAAFDWVGNWLDSFYTAAGGEDDFFAGLFDTRDNSAYLVFHSACKDKFELTDLVIKTSLDASGAGITLTADTVANGLTAVAVKAMEDAIESRGYTVLDEITNALNYAKAQLVSAGDDAKAGIARDKEYAIGALGSEFNSLSEQLNGVSETHKTEMAALWEETKQAGSDANEALNALSEKFQQQFGQDSAVYEATLEQIQTLSAKVDESLQDMQQQNTLAIEYNQKAEQYISSLAEADEQSLKLLSELEDKVNAAASRIDNAASQSDDLISQLEQQSQESMEGGTADGVTEDRVMQLIEENSAASGGDDAMGDSMAAGLTAMEVKDMITEAINTLRDSLTVSSSGAVEVEIDPASTEDFA